MLSDTLASRAEQMTKVFNKNVVGFEKIRNTYVVKKIPQTDLGKIKTNELLCNLGVL